LELFYKTFQCIHVLGGGVPGHNKTSVSIMAHQLTAAQALEITEHFLNTSMPKLAKLSKEIREIADEIADPTLGSKLLACADGLDALLPPAYDLDAETIGELMADQAGMMDK
jgi:hypothetical protein